MAAEGRQRELLGGMPVGWPAQRGRGGSRWAEPRAGAEMLLIGAGVGSRRKFDRCAPASAASTTRF